MRCMKGRSLLYAVPLRSLTTFLFVASSSVVLAQSSWRVDSLMNTWPIQLAMEEARHAGKPGVIKAVPTRDLLSQLRTAAPSMPVFVDSNVVRYVELYGEPKRDEFRAMLGMAQQYFPLVESELAKAGLPKEWKYVPMALSAMNTLAASQDGGAGLWMLTYPVALRYGLTVTADRDERRDPQLATMAAVRYLKDLCAQYDDRNVALLAFLCGPANVARSKARTNSATDSRALYPHFTTGSRDVLPLLMAFVHLGTHAAELGIVAMDVEATEATDSLRSNNELHLGVVASTLGLDRGRLQSLNPLWCSDRVPALETLLLPRGELARFELLSDSILRAQQQLAESRVATPPAFAGVAGDREAIHYRVRSGDYLGSIAMRFGVKVSQLKSWNHLRSDRIGAGDKLVIYVSASQRARYERHIGKDGSSDDGPTNRAAPKGTGTTAIVPAPVSGFTWYTVQAGDSLYAIARRYQGVDVKRLMEVNGITANIKPGQKLKIPVAK